MPHTPPQTKERRGPPRSFPRKLYDLIEKLDSEKSWVAEWKEDGSAFDIKDSKAFLLDWGGDKAQWKSFTKQLNKYAFEHGRYGEKLFHHCKHKYFKRGELESLMNVNIKKYERNFVKNESSLPLPDPSTTRDEEIELLKSEIGDLKRRIDAMEMNFEARFEHSLCNFIEKYNLSPARRLNSILRSDKEESEKKRKLDVTDKESVKEPKDYISCISLDLLVETVSGMKKM